MHEFDLIGDIGIDITAQSVAAMLKEANGEDVTFYIASLGGSLSDGDTIYGLIKKYPGKTTGKIIGNTASAGTIAILGCDTVEENSSALFLIHNSSDPVGGNASELQTKVAQLERHDKIMRSIYHEKTGLPDAKLIELMARQDWLTPDEALQYGFVDKIISAGKVVAYYPNDKLTTDLLTKLNNKMKIFGKNKEDVKATGILALKDGKQLLINAEVAAKGVEVAPIGAATTLDDGTYELSDGRKIVVAGGVITEVQEVAAPGAAGEVNAEAIITAVSETVVAEIAKVKAEMQAEIKAELVKISSTYKPEKGKGTGDGKEKQVSITAKVNEITGKIRENIVKSREA
jgi:ATP-dependent protease ClpP protease subunit